MKHLYYSIVWNDKLSALPLDTRWLARNLREHLLQALDGFVSSPKESLLDLPRDIGGGEQAKAEEARLTQIFSYRKKLAQDFCHAMFMKPAVFGEFAKDKLAAVLSHSALIKSAPGLHQAQNLKIKPEDFLKKPEGDIGSLYLFTVNINLNLLMGNMENAIPGIESSKSLEDFSQQEYSLYRTMEDLEEIRRTFFLSLADAPAGSKFLPVQNSTQNSTLNSRPSKSMPSLGPAEDVMSVDTRKERNFLTHLNWGGLLDNAQVLVHYARPSDFVNDLLRTYHFKSQINTLQHHGTLLASESAEAMNLLPTAR